jgi:hypothetical protein
MSNAAIRMTGIGCFAGGITLSRVLRRMMDSYSLEDWSGAGGFRQAPPPAVQALQKLMSVEGSPGQSGHAIEQEGIAGFFLNFENERLNLSVFTRDGGRRCRKYTASLLRSRLRP